MFKSLIVAGFALALAATASQAGVRNFFAPQFEGALLDACLTPAGECGKPVADAFCKAQGFQTAILFQWQSAGGQFTRRLGSGESCENGACTTFRQIKCFAPA